MLVTESPVIHGARALLRGTVVCEVCCRHVNPVVLRFNPVGGDDVACPVCPAEGWIFDGTTLASPGSTMMVAADLGLV